MNDADQQLGGAQENASPMFPKSFPNGCPPTASKDASGEVYRIVGGTPLIDEYFLSHDELGIALDGPPCIRCGLSVFDSISSAKHRQRLSPHLGGFIAKGMLSPPHGKMGEPSAKSRHLTWWPYVGVIRRLRFEEPIKCL